MKKENSLSKAIPKWRMEIIWRKKNFGHNFTKKQGVNGQTPNTPYNYKNTRAVDAYDGTIQHTKERRFTSRHILFRTGGQTGRACPNHVRGISPWLHTQFISFLISSSKKINHKTHMEQTACDDYRMPRHLCLRGICSMAYWNFPRTCGQQKNNCLISSDSFLCMLATVYAVCVYEITKCCADCCTVLKLLIPKGNFRMGIGFESHPLR